MDAVRVGEPITTVEATTAILRMIKSPLVGDVTLDQGPGQTIERLKKNCYPFLSGGERRLLDIAEGVWWPQHERGARIGAIGGLDPDNRRKVIVVLAYLYLGRDLSIFEMNSEEFFDVFGRAPRCQICGVRAGAEHTLRCPNDPENVRG